MKLKAVLSLGNLGEVYTRPQLWAIHLCGRRNRGSPKCPQPNPQNLRTLTYMAKGILQMWLSKRSWDGEIILEAINIIIISVLVRGRQREICPWNRRRWCDKGSRLWGWRKGPQTKYRRLLKIEKGKETDSPLRVSRRSQLCQMLMLALWNWFWTSDLQSCIVLSH